MHNEMIHHKGQWGRFRFEDEDGIRVYETQSAIPYLTFPTAVCDHQSQMAEEGIVFKEAIDILQQSIDSHPEIDRVALRHRDSRYSIIILLRELTEEGLFEAHNCFRDSFRHCGSRRPLVTVLGPRQKDSYVFYAADSHIIYGNPNEFNVPAMPPLG